MNTSRKLETAVGYTEMMQDFYVAQKNAQRRTASTSIAKVNALFDKIYEMPSPKREEAFVHYALQGAF